MNYLVFVDAQAGELEKILSGVKTMLVQEFDLAHLLAHPINAGDSLYFLKDQEDCAVRVKASVVRVLIINNTVEEDPPHTLKAMQPRLQLTEDQYNHWSAKQRLLKQQLLLVEFGSAQKISMIHVAPEKIVDRSGWIAFEDFRRVTD